MTSVRLSQLCKNYGSTAAVLPTDLDVTRGELFFLLGPSGCGKSTLLRLIAGLLEPSAGKIFFDDREVTHLPTEKRNAVMCFQSYALWPHMTVRQNVEFGLSVRKLNASRRRQRGDEVLRLVQMEHLADRKPAALSGGQQQRVALARALAVEPACLLLDEPLSNLDAKLRHEMRSEIRRICKSAGLTTIYVTHDQKEAMAVADRIALMKDGAVVQIGKPAELYQRPRTSFVADFLGQTNLISGSVVGRDQQSLSVETPIGTVHAAADGEMPQNVILSIRPERIRLVDGSSPQSPGVNRLPAKLVETTYLGETSEHLLGVADAMIKVLAWSPTADAPGPLFIEFDSADAVVLAE